MPNILNRLFKNMKTPIPKPTSISSMDDIWQGFNIEELEAKYKEKNEKEAEEKHIKELEIKAKKEELEREKIAKKKNITVIQDLPCYTNRLEAYLKAIALSKAELGRRLGYSGKQARKRVFKLCNQERIELDTAYKILIALGLKPTDIGKIFRLKDDYEILERKKFGVDINDFKEAEEYFDGMI